MLLEPSDLQHLPERLHFVWLGSEPSTAILRRLYEWARLNPGFDVYLWQDGALDDLARKDERIDALLAIAPNAAATSDIVRFALLHAVGGIYLDADFEACRPISALLENHRGFVARESRASITASVIGLPSGDAFASAALAVMADVAGRRGAVDNFVTGPPLVTELIRAFCARGVPCPAVLEPWTFFPDNPYRFPRRLRRNVAPYGIHLYDHSWGQGRELHWARRLARGALQVLAPKDAAVGARRRTQLELRRLSADHVAALKDNSATTASRA